MPVPSLVGVELLHHQVLKNGSRILEAQFFTFETGAPVIYRTNIIGGGRAKDIIDHFDTLHNNGSYSVMNSLPEVLEEVVHDLINKVLYSTITPHGKFFDVISLNENDVKLFENDWKMKCFKSAIKSYGVEKKLSLEQATRVLQDHYIVEVIHDS